MSRILNRIFRQRRRRQFEAPIALKRIATHHEYATYMDRMISEYNMRRQVERSLILNQNSFTVPGWCFICRKQVSFHVDFSYSYYVDEELTPNWREHLRCPGCGFYKKKRVGVSSL